MAFRLPNFNLAVNVWRSIARPPVGPPDVVAVGNLTPGHRSYPSAPSTPTAMILLLPAGTDIRAAPQTGSTDLVEVPAGSGRFYVTFFVDDVAKGFANEHRTAGITADGGWPVPIP